jgi:hypothetical protein
VGGAHQGVALAYRKHPPSGPGKARFTSRLAGIFLHTFNDGCIFSQRHVTSHMA